MRECRNPCRHLKFQLCISYIYTQNSCDLPLFLVFSFISLFSHLVTLLPLFSFCSATTAPPGGAVCTGLRFHLWCVSQSSQILSILCYPCIPFSSSAFFLTGHAHTFRPQIVKSIARPSSPSPLSTDASPPAPAPPLPEPHPYVSDSGNA